MKGINLLITACWDTNSVVLKEKILQVGREGRGRWSAGGGDGRWEGEMVGGGSLFRSVLYHRLDMSGSRWPSSYKWGSDPPGMQKAGGSTGVPVRVLRFYSELHPGWGIQLPIVAGESTHDLSCWCDFKLQKKRAGHESLFRAIYTYTLRTIIILVLYLHQHRALVYCKSKVYTVLVITWSEVVIA